MYDFFQLFQSKPLGELPLRLGERDAAILGGPFSYASKLGPEYRKVRLAEELNLSADLVLPIQDWKVPTDLNQVNVVLKCVLADLVKGTKVYAGCMGGRGRTGLFMALLTKVAQDYDYRYNPDNLQAYWGNLGPVPYVRANYYPHAVETETQFNYVRDFDTRELVHHLRRLLPRAWYQRAWDSLREVFELRKSPMAD